MRALSVVSLTIVLAGCASTASPSPPRGEGRDDAPARVESAASTGRMGTHGMVIFGVPDHAFLSHIPMFQAPHDVQLVARASLSAPGGLPSDLSDRLYTFVPQRFSLDALRLGELGSLHGTLFVGNFEQGGQPIATNVTATIAQVVHQHVLDPLAVPADPAAFLVVGSTERAFAIRILGGPPGRDEILRVSFDGAPPEGQALDDGFVTTLEEAHVASSSVLSCLVGPDFSDVCE